MSDNEDARLWRAVRDSSTEFAIITTDLTGRITSWNVGARNMFGWDEDEALGRNISMIFYPSERASGQPEEEMSLALGQGSAEDERWHLRKDGSRFWASGRMMPLSDENGTVLVGYLKIVRDLTDAHIAAQEQARMRHQLERNERRLRLALEAGRMAIWEYIGATDTIKATPELKKLLGFSPDAEVTTEDIRARYAPGEKERLWNVFQENIYRGDETVEAEIRCEWDDEVRWFQLRGDVIHSEGAPPSIFGVAFDITERKRREETLQLLAAELDHRIKNTMAMVQSVARQTLRNAVSVAMAAEALDSRLCAMSQAHDLLTQERWVGADLRELAKQTAAVHGGRQIRLDGGPVRLPPRLALSIALALHELATNAVKYGALSSEGGQVYLGWSVEPAADASGLTIRWEETGGPVVEAPTRRGFGTRLIEGNLAAEPGGEVRLDFRPEGVVCTMQVQLTWNDSQVSQNGL